MKLYLEIIRIIAVFFVIFNHSEGFSLFVHYDPDTIKYWGYMILSIICRCNVPLFFIISGALLLNKDENISKVITHRISRILSVLVFVSLLYYLGDIWIFKLEQFSLFTFISYLFTYKIAFHLWFLYVFIFYLLILPFLQAMVKHLQKVHFYYMLMLSLIYVGLLPIIIYFVFSAANVLDYVMDIRLILLSFITLFPCIGFYLENKLNIEDISNKHILLIWLINIFMISISCYSIYKIQYITMNDIDVYPFCYPSVIINCIVTYITIKYICIKIKFNKIISNILISMGRCTFGIYLAHVAVMNYLNQTEIFDTFHNHMNYILIYCSLVFIISYFITLIIKKIPFINRFI